MNRVTETLREEAWTLCRCLWAGGQGSRQGCSGAREAVGRQSAGLRGHLCSPACTCAPVLGAGGSGGDRSHPRGQTEATRGAEAPGTRERETETLFPCCLDQDSVKFTKISKYAENGSLSFCLLVLQSHFFFFFGILYNGPLKLPNYVFTQWPLIRDYHVMT